MKLIINISEEDRTRIGNLHFIPEELRLEIAFAISNGTPIPDNATNGDVIKAMFGKEFADKCIDYCNSHMVGGEWWNAPYQKGGK